MRSQMVRHAILNNIFKNIFKNMSDIICDCFETRSLLILLFLFAVRKYELADTEHGACEREIFFHFFEIHPEEVTKNRAKMKEETARERFGILCGDSSRFTQT